MFRRCLQQVLSGCMAASVAMLLASAVQAQEAPDPALLERFATFDALRVTAPQEALDLGDGLLAETDDPGLRMTLARTAAQVEEWPRVIAYAEPLAATLPPQDPLLTEALDLLDAAHSALGEAETALGYALRAYNAAESRLGLENPALLARLDALEPRVAALRPDLLSALEGFRAAIEEAIRRSTSEGVSTVRATGDPDAVVVWYGTNRIATGEADPAEAYGYDPGPLSVGRLTVTIPPGHLAGMIERPSTWSLTGRADPKEHVVLASLEALTKEAFAEGCCGADDRLLFIHGYNVSFHDGALRAAQLSFDLEFGGETLYYSWPSRGSVLGYLTDSNRVVASRPAVVEFLELATRGEGALHIVAHSMGNRYALEALDTFVRDYPERRIGQLILAAPDVDRAELKARFPAIAAKAEGVTLYASRNDIALQVSRRVNGARRAGDAGGEPVLIAGLDTIDASEIEADTLGHSYFGDASQILADILGVVELGREPARRCAVAPVVASAGGTLWNVRPDGCAIEQLRVASDLVRLHGEGALAEGTSRVEKASGDELEFWTGVLALLENRLEAR